MMTDGSDCCCMHIKTCATIVGVLGLIAAIGSCFSCLLIPIAIPAAFGMLLTYIFVLVGVKNESPGYMLAAEVILGIKVAFGILACIFVVIFGFFSSNSLTWIYRKSVSLGSHDEYSRHLSYNNNAESFKQTVQMIFVFFALFILFLSSWNIYSCIVVHRARNWFEGNASRAQPAAYYPYGMAPMQVHVYGSGLPQQGLTSAPGTPQGYVTDAPPFYPAIPQINSPNPSVYPQLSSPPPTAPPQELSSFNK